MRLCFQSVIQALLGKGRIKGIDGSSFCTYGTMHMLCDSTHTRTHTEREKYSERYNLKEYNYMVL